MAAEAAAGVGRSHIRAAAMAAGDSSRGAAKAGAAAAAESGGGSRAAGHDFRPHRPAIGEDAAGRIHLRQSAAHSRPGGGGGFAGAAAGAGWRATAGSHPVGETTGERLFVGEKESERGGG